MKTLFQFLIQHGYKPIDLPQFSQRLKENFGLFNFTEKQQTLYISHPKGYEIDVAHQFINTYEFEFSFIQEMKILEEGVLNEDNKRFLLYNKILFNNDIGSITQVLHDKKAVEDLVIYFDYEKNPMLLNFALNYNTPQN